MADSRSAASLAPRSPQRCPAWGGPPTIRSCAMPRRRRPVGTISWPSCPPVPAAATAVLAGLLSRLGGASPGCCSPRTRTSTNGPARIHLLAAETGLVWCSPTAPAVRHAGASKTGQSTCWSTSPAAALALHRRSALRPETLAAVCSPGRKSGARRASIASLMQDLRRRRSASSLASAPDRAGDLVERYARRALTVGAPGWTEHRSVGTGPDGERAVEPAGRPFRAGRAARSRPRWSSGALDRGARGERSASVPSCRTSSQLVTGDAPSVQTVIAFDPPTPARLRSSWRRAKSCCWCRRHGSVRARIAPPAGRCGFRVHSIRGERAEARRAAIVATLETGPLDRRAAHLAPLFERYDAGGGSGGAVRALVGRAGRARAAPVAEADVVGDVQGVREVGKKDGATVNDLVAVLTKEVRVDREKDRASGAAGRLYAGGNPRAGGGADCRGAQPNDDQAEAGHGKGG